MTQKDLEALLGGTLAPGLLIHRLRGRTPRILRQVEWSMLGLHSGMPSLQGCPYFSEYRENAAVSASGHREGSSSWGSFWECQPRGSRRLCETGGTEITSNTKRKALDSLLECT